MWRLLSARSIGSPSVRFFGVLVAGAILVGAGGCAGIEGDIRRAEMREFFQNIYKGKDRGSSEYLRTIRDHSTKPAGRRYQHRAPAHISQFLIERAVRGLGSTRFQGPDDMAVATDQIVYVLAYDPAASTRSLAAAHLGRLYLRLPEAALPPVAEDGRADQQINIACQDLFNYAQKLRKGKRVTNRQIVDRLDALRKQQPPTLISAQQMIRALASRPVARAAPGPLRTWTKKIAPGLLRIGILVALREVAFGDPIRPEFPPDPSPLVRAAAIESLTRIRWRDALSAAAARLSDPYDAPETSPDVQVKAMAYFGAVGGPRAFELAIVGFDDKDANVRYQALRALQDMTGTRVEPTVAAWRAWQADHAEWRVAPAAKVAAAKVPEASAAAAASKR